MGALPESARSCTLPSPNTSATWPAEETWAFSTDPVSLSIDAVGVGAIRPLAGVWSVGQSLTPLLKNAEARKPEPSAVKAANQPVAAGPENS